MGLELEIKEFVRGQGVDVVGVAGPERLGGPPSLDAGYTMKGARSVVSMATPMDVDAIYAFLSKKSPSPHNVDQLHSNQRIHRVARDLAAFIRSQGYRAAVVPPNNSYRRSLDVFSTHPSFSHRFAAILAGTAGQGWSGNVMTKEYGASVYLCSVVTDAVLASDEMLSPRYFVDGYCSRCKLCARTCVAGMFEEEEEDYVLLNGELYPRGARRNVDLCNASCFGLHSLSKDKTWSTWGRHWIDGWVGRRPPTGRVETRRDLIRGGRATGDATARFDVIRIAGKTLIDDDLMKELPLPADLPDDQREMDRILWDFEKKQGSFGKSKDPNVLTCGQCAMVCGPTLKETASRYKALIEGGIVVPGEGGEMVRVDSYAEAVEVRRANPQRSGALERVKDSLASFALCHRYYFGIEPKSIVGAIRYERARRRAINSALTSPEE